MYFDDSAMKLLKTIEKSDSSGQYAVFWVNEELVMVELRKIRESKAGPSGKT